MGTSRFSLCLLLALVGASSSNIPAAEKTRTGNIPSGLVTTTTRQVYRFHFSGLHGADAVRLAEQLWPVVSKLPSENPLYRSFHDAKDREGFAEDFRSLRNIFLEADIDTFYFLADESWIESRMLPGTVAISGDAAARDRLQRKLKASGHDAWASTIAQFRPSSDAPGWLEFKVGAVPKGQASPAKQAIVDHALKESCRITPAAPYLGSLPALRMSLNETTPLTVVNLERNKLDSLLMQVLAALVPASEQAAKLSENVVATTVVASFYPFPYVRQVGHLKTAAEATALAEEIKKQIKGAIQNVVKLDADLGPIVGQFAQSTVVVSTQGSDVHLIMKPPMLFDLQQATIKVHGAQDLDWTALPPPSGYHWELVGPVGGSSRRDVFARIHRVRVRGEQATIAPDKSSSAKATFRIPLADSELVLTHDLKGELQIEPGKKRAKSAKAPALELLDDRGRLAAILRLDLGPGDPRFDLARTRSVLAVRKAENVKRERAAKKDVDDAENAQQRGRLEKLSRVERDELEENLRRLYREHGYLQANGRILHELDDQARESQRQYPAATLVMDGGVSTAEAAWRVDRDKYPFAGRWLFDYGELKLYQDTSGNVAGVFATKVFSHTSRFEIDRSKPTTGCAVLSGRVKGSKLNFTMFDFRGRERSGQLVLDDDGAGGAWSFESTTKEPTRGTRMNRATRPPRGKAVKEAEDSRSGPLDRIEVSAPDPLWTPTVPAASFAGYWVHPTDKRMNTLYKSQPSGLLEGVQGNPSPGGNLRAASAGNLLLILEHVNVGVLTPSVREALLSADGQKLKYIGPGGALNGNVLELTRDSKE